jgi:hypothetical protein
MIPYQKIFTLLQIGSINVFVDKPKGYKKMKKYAFLFSICVLFALVPRYGFTANPSTGNFKATMGDKKYDLDVTCDAFGTDQVMFRSDDSGYVEAKDINGDGIAITGAPGLFGEGLTMVLEINDKGQLYVVNSGIIGQKLDLEMSGNTLTGKGKMLSMTSQPTIEFTLTCQ